MKYALYLSLLWLVAACTKPAPVDTANDEMEITYFAEEDLNYPAEGFDIEGSSTFAIVVADKVMTAMGGRKNWNETRYITWNFFDARVLLWDKQANRVRVETKAGDFKAILDMNTGVGKVWKDGVEYTQPDSLSKYLDRAKRIWINDSYWLVMPFKLKDTGVTLSFVGEDETMQAEPAYILKLTFNEVGVTPQNAYEVWVSKEDNLVKQWAYYANVTDEQPGFILPWTEYFQAGNILLSGNRGERSLTDIRVLPDVDERVFQSFDVSLP